MRRPFARPFYGWSIIAVAFVTMGIGVNARTAFSLFFPPILDEFGWPRGLTAGAFSFGFLVSAFLGPVLGRLMDRRGPRAVMLLGVAMVGAGLGLAPLVRAPWHLYLTLGVLVGGGTVCLGYTGHALFLPNWFVRRRGLAIGIAFSGVGVGAIIILPWLQRLIAGAGWRTACLAMAALVLVGFTGIVGQIALGHLSDRVGREWVWTLACVGFVLSYALLLAMRDHPTPALLYLMVGAQGVLGYGLASVFGAIPAELFQGKHYGTIFGTLSLASIVGGAIGPWVAGALYDRTGSYVLAFWLAIGASVVSAVALWLAAPRKVRAVAGRVPRGYKTTT